MKENSFWIFFDTSTLPDYYLDVHNVLSLPPGFLVRYNYRKKYLSKIALEALKQIENRPKKVLFVYSQLKSYKRGENVPNHPNHFDEMCWVPFRLGELVSIPNPEEAGVNFDLKVIGYPINLCSKIYSSLKEEFLQNNTPFNKWVTISEDIDGFNSLINHESSISNSNWENIINIIGSPPIQFSGDSFWRIHLEDQNENIIEPLIDSTSYHQESYFSLKDDTEYILRIKSHTPVGIDKENGSSIKNQRNIVITSNNVDVIKMDTVESLRQYTEFAVKFKTEKIRGFGSKKCVISFATRNGQSEFFFGPEFNICIKVSQKTWEQVIGYISLVLALFFFVISVNLMIASNLFLLLTLLIAIILSIFAGYFLWREPRLLFS